FTPFTLPLHGAAPNQTAHKQELEEGINRVARELDQSKADQSAVEAVADEVAAKADQADLDALAGESQAQAEDMDRRVPQRDADGPAFPIAAIGGDAVIRYDGGVDYDPSERMMRLYQVGEVDRRLPQRVAPAGATPLAALGGDLALWHDGKGLGYIPSPDQRADYGIPKVAASGGYPIWGIGPDVMLAANAAGEIDMAPSQRTVDQIAARLPPLPTPDTTPPAVYGQETLRRMRARIAALRQGQAGARLRVLLIGDSWVALNPFRAGVAAVLTREHELIGEGWLSANTGYGRLTGAGHTASSGWTVIDGTGGGRIWGDSPDGQSIGTDEAGQTITWTNLRCTRFSIYALENGGTWRYRVDSGAWTEVTDATGGALNRVEITGLADANHTIEIESVSGTVAMGGYFMARDGVSGVEISRFGDGASTARVHQAYLPRQAQVMADEPPDLIITHLGGNDSRQPDPNGSPESYVRYMTDLLAEARAIQPDVSAIHQIPPRNGMAVQRPTTVYRDAIHAADLGTAYLSLTEHYDAFPQADALGLWVDLVHPSFLGGRMIGDLLNDLLIRI
ncbi:SGNH/GDSL hydrolase family protein, partial [uncultured Paracoccus sp.]|uniref:SGNH/GDSL hydrolase family protein n=1 Tax=uncultured Paracoccus sp. TaxID=189685 RepID=UPI0025FA10AC